MKNTLHKAALMVCLVIMCLSLQSFPQEITIVKQNVPDSMNNQQNNKKFKKYFYLVHYYDYFKKPHFLSWHLTSAQAKFKSKEITYMGFINYGQVLNGSSNLFNNLDIQYRMDVYPTFDDHNYAYISYAFSKSDIFPDHQARGIFYHQFGKGFETSLGLYYMGWDDPLMIYTGSVAKYYKNYWFSLRPYLQFEEGKLYQSYLLFARRYFGSSDDYLNLMIGYGSSPDNQAYLYNFEDIYTLKSFNLQLNYQKSLKHWLFLIGQV